MPRVLTNEQALKIAQKGARYEDGKRIAKFVAPAPKPVVVVPPPPKPEPAPVPKPQVIVQEKQVLVAPDMSEVVKAIKALVPAPKTDLPHTYELTVTARGADGRISKFLVVEK